MRCLELMLVMLIHKHKMLINNAHCQIVGDFYRSVVADCISPLLITWIFAITNTNDWSVTVAENIVIQDYYQLIIRLLDVLLASCSVRSPWNQKQTVNRTDATTGKTDLKR